MSRRQHAGKYTRMRAGDTRQADRRNQHGGFAAHRHDPATWRSHQPRRWNVARSLSVERDGPPRVPATSAAHPEAARRHVVEDPHAAHRLAGASRRRHGRRGRLPGDGRRIRRSLNGGDTHRHGPRLASRRLLVPDCQTQAAGRCRDRPGWRMPQPSEGD